MGENTDRVGNNGRWQKVKDFKRKKLLSLQRVFFDTCMLKTQDWLHAIPRALLLLKVISFSLGLAFAVVLLWLGVFHPFVTFLA